MKAKEMEVHTIQINKVRGQLNDYVNPVSEIVKPKYMLTRVFVTRIKRLTRHEAEFKRKLQLELNHWMEKTYY
jgi:hypothetical protein